jgi:hypothetical protein
LFIKVYFLNAFHINAFRKKSVLTERDERIFFKIFEVITFSQAYCTEKANEGTGNKNDDSLSSSVRIIRRMTLLGFENAEISAHKHFFKLTRSLLKTVKTLFVKLLQDVMRYQTCVGCPKTAVKDTERDAKALLEIIHFIASEGRPWEISYKSLHKYSVTHQQSLDDILALYTSELSWKV